MRVATHILAMSQQQGRQHTKVAIRRLPPTLTEEVLIQAVHSAVDRSQYNWIYFVPGKQSLKRVVNAVAFVDFKTAADVSEFSSKFQNAVFTSEDGTRAVCHVQYAPCQKTPRSRPRRDPREGMLATDRDYIDFVEKLNAPVSLLPSAEIQLQEKEKVPSSQAELKVVTPLMEYVRMQHMKSIQAAMSGASKKSAKPSRRAKDSASKTAPPKVVPIPLQGPSSSRDTSKSEEAHRAEKRAPSKGKESSAQEEVREGDAPGPKLLLRRQGDSEGSKGAGGRGPGAGVAKRDEGSGNPNERVRSGHQAYVPRSARVNAEASSSDQKPQSKGSSGDTSGQSNAHEGSRRRRPPSAGQQGKGGRGRSGKGKGAKSVLLV